MGFQQNQTLENIHTSVIHEFSKTLELFGLTPSDSRLFTSLYLHAKPMTLDELSEALGKSKTAISTGVRSLIDQGLVERVWKKGVRKDLYKSNDQLYKKFMFSYVQRWIDAASTQRKTLQSIKQELSNEDTSSELVDERLAQMIEFHKQISNSFEKFFKSN
ncbi:GbsR/MarR family transcriptional regulator [Halobacillus sp. B23F22_1]|uniref:GbsR/MarR family transcriptional regulator n=1 Tax=Halobacillus sp. B23F22_1 TaxID=3459514 RepID=UPI00373E7B94